MKAAVSGLAHETTETHARGHPPFSIGNIRVQVRRLRLHGEPGGLEGAGEGDHQLEVLLLALVVLGRVHSCARQTARLDISELEYLDVYLNLN